MIGRLNPPAAPTLAKLCRRSCSRTPSSAAALRTRDQTLSIAGPALSARMPGLPSGSLPNGVVPGAACAPGRSDKRLWRRSCCLVAADIRARNRHTPSIRLAISDLRQPVSKSSLIAADGYGLPDRSSRPPALRQSRDLGFGRKRSTLRTGAFFTPRAGFSAQAHARWHRHRLN